MNIHNIYQPFLKYFRRKRMARFKEHFKPTSDMCILDLGGTPFNWQFLPDLPKPFYVNIHSPKGYRNAETWIIADGRNLPFKDKAFDLVYSNSVIEHLGNYANQEKFASECIRTGIRYYIQTPNKWFPIEPHLITPIIHWLPHKVQTILLRFTIWGIFTKPSQHECENFIKEVRLVDKREIQMLFPDAIIWHERLLGWTKSFIATKL